MGTVRIYPPTLVTSGSGQSIRAALPIRGNGQWRDLALAQNWLQGAGNTLMTSGPIYDPGATYAIDPGGSQDVVHYIADNDQTLSYLWLITLMKTSPGSATGEIANVDSLTIGSWELGSGTAGDQRIRCIRIITPRDYVDAGPPRSLTLRITNSPSSESAIFIANAKLIEMPRYSVPEFTDERTLQSGEPIYDDGQDPTVTSLWGCQSQFIDTVSIARRACLLSFRLPAAFSTTNTTFNYATGTPISGSYPNPIRPRCLRGESTTTLEWQAGVRGVGGDGELQLTTGNVAASITTDVVTTAITSAGAETLISGTIDCRTEDITRTNCWRDDAPEYISMALRCTTATSVEFFGFWLREPA